MPADDGPVGSVGPAGLRLDCTGMRCPRPIIEIARRIGSVAVGETVELLADDPATAPDLAAWCRMRGHTLLHSAPPRFLVVRDR